MKDFRNYSPKDHNTFGIDAKCSRYLEFEDDFEAMDVINNNARGVVYVCSGLRLRGVLTDGIIRRHIMHGGQLEALVGQVMNAEPRYLWHSDSADPYVYMEEIGITSVPILNENKEIRA